MKISISKLLVMAALGVIWSVPHEALAANEARCSELGGNCVCSEPLNTTAYATISTYWRNPGDTTAKECSVEGPGLGAMELPGGFTFTTPSSGEAISALPAGHTNAYVLKANPGNVSGFFGTTIPAGQPTARRAIRWYVYYSPDFTFSPDAPGNTCNSGKIAEFGPQGWLGPMFTGQNWSFYGVQTSMGFNQNTDPCCTGGPGPDSGPSHSAMQGKWWRIEIVLHNASPAGAPIGWDVYVKNVTDNQAELHVVDTSMTNSQWTAAIRDSIHPTSTLNALLVNFYRGGNFSGTPSNCQGYAAYSHMLVATWSTDAGQRIGAACEIEGGRWHLIRPAAAGPHGLKFL